MSIEERLCTDRRLAEFSTFGIGGPIRLYFQARTLEDVKEAIEYAFAQKIPYFILGAGSNCLFDDRGYNGLMIHNEIVSCHFEKNLATVGAGFRFAALGINSAKQNLSGLEFAAGIPGSVGGAIFMNAGCNQMETAKAVHEVVYCTEMGEVRTFSKEELSFGYRRSPFQSMKGAIISAKFIFKEDPNARELQKTFLQSRKESQPLNKKSAGCVFRNPTTGLSAGRLIDDCQLKGCRIGDAMVSCKHANFIVNEGFATSADVRALIELVRQTVYDRTKVDLQTEIREVEFE